MGELSRATTTKFHGDMDGGRWEQSNSSTRFIKFWRGTAAASGATGGPSRSSVEALSSLNCECPTLLSAHYWRTGLVHIKRASTRAACQQGRSGAIRAQFPSIRCCPRPWLACSQRQRQRRSKSALALRYLRISTDHFHKRAKRGGAQAAAPTRLVHDCPHWRSPVVK